jgi:FkbM family methyltransferase
VINLKAGSAREIDGKTFIETKQGVSGHAVYGPYEQFQEGRYAVEFELSMVERGVIGNNELCAVVDVTSSQGAIKIAKANLTVEQIESQAGPFLLGFTLHEPTTLEFRVYVTGRDVLLINGHPRATKINDDDDIETAVADSGFPNPSIPNMPSFFANNIARLQKLYDNGVGVRILDSDVVLNVRGVNLYARCLDDLRFIGEVYLRNTYNFICDGDACVIDIGMNIGLASLFFATKSFVKEVHSYEPFKRTYDRALANISLNPSLSAKISPNNCGLADFDDMRTVFIPDNDDDSGYLPIRGVKSGEQVQISVRNAAPVLAPIVESAISRGLKVIAKLDCEGSEFAIFDILESTGILGKISAFMVEWHKGIGEKTQKDLIEPLLKHGFMIFDITASSGDGRNSISGNGFFYAARMQRELDNPENRAQISSSRRARHRPG